MSNERIEGLLQFLHKSPSPFHATANLAALFELKGYAQLNEADSWSLSAGEKYYYTRSDATFVAFRVGSNPVEKGVRLLGAHTDSPCLKIKPTPEIRGKGYHQLGVEVYGGALLNPWFDRDLSLAGRVTGLDASGVLVSSLVDFEKAVAYVPSLAIHLNREANKNKTVNPQTEMNLLLDISDDKFNFRDVLLEAVNTQNPAAGITQVLDFNISAYDVQPPAVVGLRDAFLASARLDNLLSCYVAAESLLACSDLEGGEQTTVLVCNDHEEVGSRSEAGAQGTILNDLFSRLEPQADSRQRMLRTSLMFSIDNAHGVHPNYTDRHDANHGPRLNAGPVIKFNSDQSYATSSDTAAFVRWLAKDGEELPVQSFAIRADMRCGSTIGPITAANLGIKTVDIGVPQFAMHSTRELAGIADIMYLRELLDRFLRVVSIPI